MATFADLSTLLLTFFVLMLSFANIDIEKFRDLLGSVQNAFGVQMKDRGEFQPTKKEKDLGPMEQQGTPSEQVKTGVAKDEAKGEVKSEVKSEERDPHEESKEMAEKLNEMMGEGIPVDQIEIKAGSNGVRIRITGHIMFTLGQAEVKYQAYPFLDSIVEAMNNYDYYLLVEGHTDSLNISTQQFPSNWELSSARASAVVRYLINQGISHSRLSGIGHAYNYPIADNMTAEGRDMNRRVEFIFTRSPFRSVID